MIHHHQHDSRYNEEWPWSSSLVTLSAQTHIFQESSFSPHFLECARSVLCCSSLMRSVVRLCAPLCSQWALLLIIYAHCCALVCSSVLAVCQRAHEFLMKSENAEEAVVGLTSLTASLPGTTPGTAWVPLNTKLGNLFPRMNKIRRENLSERILSLALI